MLLTRGQLVRHRRFFWGSLACLAAAVAACVALRPDGHWWPNGGTTIGLILGMIAAGIIGFEMLLWPRKRWPAAPWLGARSSRTWLWGPTKLWMQWHIWLGLLSAPLAFMHSGLEFWGEWFSLPWVLGVLMIVVYVSGIYGLWLQNRIPQQLLRQVSAEVPAMEIDSTLQHHREEFRRRLELELSTYEANELVAGRRVATFFESRAWDYLSTGNPSSALAADAQAMSEFGKLQAEVMSLLPGSISRPIQLLHDLRELCSLRRQLDIQRRLHQRLHSWLLIHLPVSVLLCFLLIAHILTAMKYL